MKSIFCVLSIIVIVMANAETLEEQLACADNMEICQAQVTILINSLSNVESYASLGSVSVCDPSNVADPGWWVQTLIDFGVDATEAAKLKVCEGRYWAYFDGMDYLSTCVAYENSEFEDLCPSDELYCSLTGDKYGYPTHIADALNQALATSTKSHHQCPLGGCNPLDDYWKSIMQEEGVSASDVEKLCTYDNADLDQIYYVEDMYTIRNTCVVHGDQWDADCTAHTGRVCSALNQGLNVVGWPKQQARMVVKAMEETDKNHPQCTVSTSQ